MTYVAEIEKWRAGRYARLTGPDGWLSLVGLDWLHEGPNTIGSESSSDVRLPAGKGPRRLGLIHVRGERVTAQLEPDSGVTHQGEAVTSLALRDDSDGTPTVLELGTLSFHLIGRAGRLGVRIRDRERPKPAALRGIEIFPIDPRWRVEARFDAFDPPREIPVPNILGFEETAVVPGALDFDLDGAPCRLLAFDEAGTDDLFIVFGDQTNGRDTYGAGRYLYASPPDDAGVVILDFNRAYNPPCVFTQFATCVLPLPENRLPVRVEAGEKTYRPPAEDR